MFYKKKQGQTFIEYSLMLGVLVTVLVAMTPMMRRGVQGMVKLVSDQVGTQKNAEQLGGRYGQLVNATTFSHSTQDIQSSEWLGITSKGYTTDKVYTESSAYMNQGFSPKDD